jgi:hypothetical protein
MSFSEKPTTKDLSDIAELKKFPSFQSSMAGGNMVSDKDKNFAGQGSDSEASHDVVAGDVSWVGSAQNVPDLPGPETPAADLAVDEKGKGYSPTPLTWKDCS